MLHRAVRLCSLFLLCCACLPAAARAVEPDGALIRLTTNNWTYRIVGGSPLHIGTCNYTNNCEGRKDVANLNGYRAYPADGALVNGLSDGGTYRFAGGTPLWISRCNYGGGCASVIRIDDVSFKDSAHIKPVPVDNTVVRNVDDGGFYRFAGGAPLLVRCDIGAGCTNPAQFDNGTFSKFGTYTPSTPRMHQFPADGTVVVNTDDNNHYRFAGGAPLPISPVASGKVIIDARTLLLSGTATPALNHMLPAPADGTFLNASGVVYRVAGGAAVRLITCAPLNNCTGAVFVEAGTIASLGGGRLRAVPKDGTVLRGLPSNQLWEIIGGTRRQTFVNVAGIAVDDGAIGLIPTPASPAPVIQTTPAAFNPVISSTYSVSRKGTRFRSLSVRDVPGGSRVSVHCSSRTRGCPYRSKSYSITTGKGSLIGKLKTRRLRTGVTLSVKITGPTGARKQMDFKMRSNKLPKRTVSCATPGAKLGKC